ncbi:uncharacterized protein LOC108736930, partial [Agrilus planipennis]|uniref:lysozyme n=1 Tax=Agrilus planipennis TaxID=224129 RepID=A0A7F5RH96_AGRPL
MAIPLGTVIRALSAFSIIFPHLVLSKVFRRCELAQELRNVHGISMNDLPMWICIAQHESQFDTSAKNAGSGDHGIFQISEIYWCSATGKGLYECGLPCSAFQDDDITDDVECAKKIYDEHMKITGDGYNAWSAYTSFCKNSTRLPLYIVGCFDEDNFIQYEPEEVKSFEGFRKAPFRQPPQYPYHPHLQFLKIANYAHQKLMFDPPLITTISPPNAFNEFIETSENEVKSQGKQVYAKPRGYSTTSNSYNLQNTFGTNYQNRRFSNPRNFPTTFRPVYRGRSRLNNQWYRSETESPQISFYPTIRTGRTRAIFPTTFPHSSFLFLNNKQNFQPDFYDSFGDESRIDSIPFQQQISQGSTATTTERTSTDAETIETSPATASTSSTPSSSTFRPIESPVPVRPSEVPIHELSVTSGRPFKHKPIRTKRPLFGHNHFHHQYEKADNLGERSSPSYKTLKSDSVTTTNTPTVGRHNDHFFIKPGTVFASVNEGGTTISTNRPFSTS